MSITKHAVELQNFYCIHKVISKNIEMDKNCSFSENLQNHHPMITASKSKTYPMPRLPLRLRIKTIVQPISSEVLFLAS
jgi:hypothetical protein